MPEDRRIEFRIGINLGDVIVEDDDIFGDGVNVAARLESVAKPGGVAVSASVRDHVGNKLDLVFEDMGEQQLKNIELPVRVYNVVLGDSPAVQRRGAADAEVAIADKPSIAVLPFTNMSGDPEQEYFSDGITEDIITDLSKISAACSWSAATPASPTRASRSQLQRVATELGVKFLLEGSVRKAGQRVRVTGQLIDGPSGGHLWADRYDRDLTDIFAIQDEITQTIVEQLKIRLLPKEKKAIEPGADRQCRGLYLLPQGPPVLPQFDQAIPLPGPADVRQGGRARSAIRARLCRHGQLRFAPCDLVWPAHLNGGNSRHR